MAEKTYVGNAKKIITKFGEAFKISLSKKDINAIVTHMKANELDWCNLEMMERKEPDKYGKTHYLAIDTWKPEKKETKPEEQFKQDIEALDNSELPF